MSRPASLLLLSFVACTETVDRPDATVQPPMDATVVEDGGVRELCPSSASAPCMGAKSCTDGGESPPPSNCEACRPYNRTVCEVAGCATPQALEVPDLRNYTFMVDPSIRAQVVWFAGAVVWAETAGGKLLSCADVYAGGFDLTNACYNVVDSRGREVGTTSDVYTMTFGRFPSGSPVLYVVYGFAMDNARGPAIGVSCGGPAEAGDPGSGMANVAGDTMRPI